jgi:hypothetical protein
LPGIFCSRTSPRRLLAEIDLTTVEISKDTDVGEDLSEDCSDLVYRVACRGGELQVYLLFEYKRRPEHWAWLQLLRYVIASGEAYRKQHPQARRLPPGYPLSIATLSKAGNRVEPTSFLLTASTCRNSGLDHCSGQSITGRA